MYKIRVYLPRKLKAWAIAEARRRGFPNTSAYIHDLMKQDQNSSKPSA
jgi:hypothetical protein